MNLVYLGVYLATSYCCSGIGGGYCGLSASGVPIGPAQIAADWRVLPPGSQVVIDGYSTADAPATVTDTGSGVHGAMVDVWFFSCDDAREWGRRLVAVSVVLPSAPLEPAPDETAAADAADDGGDVTAEDVP